MTTFDIHDLLRCCNYLAAYQQKLGIAAAEHGGIKQTKQEVEALCSAVNVIQEQAEQAGLSASYSACDTIIDEVKSYGDRWMYLNFDQIGRMKEALSYLLGATADGLREKSLIILPTHLAGLYEPDAPLFGDGVELAFPNARNDIAEAGSCLAAGRNTASVFHCMRAMEDAVKSLSTALEIPNPDREWGKLLSDISKRIENMPKGDIRDQWSESHSHLYHVKQAWRNSTMHPKKTYSEQDAKSVFDAVASFMRHLANLLTE